MCLMNIHTVSYIIYLISTVQILPNCIYYELVKLHFRCMILCLFNQNIKLKIFYQDTIIEKRVRMKKKKIQRNCFIKSQLGLLNTNQANGLLLFLKLYFPLFVFK